MSKPVDSDNHTSQPIHNLIASAQNSAEKQSTNTSQSSHFNRRRFIQGISASTAGIALTGCFDDDKRRQKITTSSGDATKVFAHGIASGDPLADRVILWTRVVPQDKQTEPKVKWRIANDEAMTDIVNQGEGQVRAADDYTFKVDADGLQPNRHYYYQFESAGVKSRVGKTKTLPVGKVDQVKLAVFSCANYPAGYFHAYADAAKRGDIDACVHLGDYIYEYGRTVLSESDNGLVEEKIAYASSNAASLHREVEPEHEIVSINDYRRRYAQYRSDKDLQELHANLAMIPVWDDHEFCNDAYKSGGENHQESEGDWEARKLAAMTAYHEWLPTRNKVISQIYRRFDFGELLSLHMLDTRIIGRDKPLDYTNYVDKAGDFKGLEFFGALLDSKRQLLGLPQHNWLAEQMSKTKTTWQVLGQQIIMGKMWIPAPILLNFNNPKTGVNLQTYMALMQKSKQDPKTLNAEEKAILAYPSIPYNLDAWDGYAAARDNIFSVMQAQNKNLVVLAGDTHNAWANNLQYKGKPVGVEFATSSVSSPGFEEYLPDVPPEQLEAALPLLAQGGTLKYTNTSKRGYLLLTVTPTQCQSEWVFVSDILKPTYSANIGKTLSVKVGENVITEG